MNQGNYPPVQQPIVVVAAQPRPTPVIHIFDGDADKIMPGMIVRIAGGAIYNFPFLPTFDPPIPQGIELLCKASAKHLKKVREMVEQHKKMTAFYERKE